MNNPAAGVDDIVAHARAADRSQAEYYRGLLAQQRRGVAKRLADDEVKLFRQQNAGDMRRIKRLKRAIRRTQTERNTLDRLIAALDERLHTR